jgi:hypothetical protein
MCTAQTGTDFIPTKKQNVHQFLREFGNRKDSNISLSSAALPLRNNFDFEI